MNRIIALILTTSSLLVACDDGKRLPSHNSNGMACTEDLRVCPNGDYVARNPANNCEFDSCSVSGISGSCEANGGCAPHINLPPN